MGRVNSCDLCSRDFRTKVVAATDALRFAEMSIVDVDPSLTAASVSHPNLCFLPDEKAFLQVQWIEFFITIKRFQYSPIRRQHHQFTMDHSPR